MSVMRTHPIRGPLKTSFLAEQTLRMITTTAPPRKRDNADSADNRFAFTLRSPDVYTLGSVGGELDSEDYIQNIRVIAADPDAPLPADPNPFETADARGAYLTPVRVENRNLNRLTYVADLYLGDKQVPGGYSLLFDRVLPNGNLGTEEWTVPSVVRSEDATALEEVIARTDADDSLVFDLSYAIKDNDRFESWPRRLNLAAQFGASATVSLININNRDEVACEISVANQALAFVTNFPAGAQEFSVRLNTTDSCDPNFGAGDYLVTTAGNLEVRFADATTGETVSGLGNVAAITEFGEPVLVSLGDFAGCDRDNLPADFTLICSETRLNTVRDGTGLEGKLCPGNQHHTDRKVDASRQ